MGRIYKECKAPTKTFMNLFTDAAAHKEKNDCWVKAAAVVTGKPYAEIHALFAAAGRKKGKGFQTAAGLDVVRSLGFTATQVSIYDIQMTQYPQTVRRKPYRSITPHHVTLYPSAWGQGTYLFFTNAHVLGVKDGLVHDWTRGRCHRVKWVYKIEKIQDENDLPYFGS